MTDKDLIDLLTLVAKENTLLRKTIIELGGISAINDMDKNRSKRDKILLDKIHKGVSKDDLS